MRSPKLWLALTFTLVGAAACSVNPLVPDGKGGSGGAAGQGGAGGTSAAGGTMGNGGTGGLDCGPAIPLPACPIGRTIVDCVVDSTGQPHWAVSCPDLTGDGGVSGTSGGGAGGGGAGAGGAGGAGGASPCTSTASCANGEACTTEDGACNAAPGCTGAGVGCPAVCYGICRPAADGPVCGTTRCAPGKTCCNSSCGICTGPNEGCTKQICLPPATGGACVTDADCRVEADYCTGCDCRALAKGQSLPPCSGPGVRCLRDPCDGARAACANGICTVAIQ